MVGLSSSINRTNQMPDTRAVVKALYIYTFATLVEWPKEKREGDFTIGVFGEKTDVYDQLYKKYTGKSIGSQKIVVNNYKNRKDIESCHILYITEFKTQYLSSIAGSSTSKNTLLVTEKEGALSNGAIMNFIVDGNRQKYEINKTNARKHKLVIADRLTKLAARVIQ